MDNTNVYLLKNIQENKHRIIIVSIKRSGKMFEESLVTVNFFSITLILLSNFNCHFW